LRIRHPAPIITSVGILVAVVIAVLVVTSGGGESRPDYPFPFQTFEDQGREHLAPGQEYDFYNSDPPTSGPHAPAPAPWGVSDAALPKEVPVHNMEHGGVVIWYDCAAGDQPLDDDACQQLRDQLAAITSSNADAGKLVLMTPYLGMDRRIALTAWRSLDSLDEFDATRVQAFIDSFERRFNPEGF
jgi:hypothetical protein